MIAVNAAADCLKKNNSILSNGSLLMVVAFVSSHELISIWRANKAFTSVERSQRAIVTAGRRDSQVAQEPGQHMVGDFNVRDLVMMACVVRCQQ
ncbi:hypothetical protein [Bradyrhizobium canariense]|uniref:hypothetical protein n=1 Tax=Bradyrhizobium canariense TaxID=255045 RepID=UPI001B8A2746|nr:hypothetical protein [Bradyrhizobium canariense]MBR0954207.1 hypothetical protein [Bradyrhizobium canariense]